MLTQHLLAGCGQAVRRALFACAETGDLGQSPVTPVRRHRASAMPALDVRAEVLGKAVELLPGSLEAALAERPLGEAPGGTRFAEEIRKRLAPECLGELLHEIELVVRALQRIRTFQSKTHVACQLLESRRKPQPEQRNQAVQQFAQPLDLLKKGRRWYRWGRRCGRFHGVQSRTSARIVDGQSWAASQPRRRASSRRERSARRS